MAGIYIHVPFCVKRCHYCDFYSSVNLKLADSFCDALLIEISNTKLFFQNSFKENLNSSNIAGTTYQDKSIINTLYFGGGTPSLLDEKNLQKIFTELHKNFVFSEDIEIAFEVNPDDVSFNYFKLYLTIFNHFNENTLFILIFYLRRNFFYLNKTYYRIISICIKFLTNHEIIYYLKRF